MHRRRALQLLAGFALCPLCTKRAFAESHWGYEGAEGPENWGNLDPTNRVWMDDVDTYLPRLPLGAVMRGSRSVISISAIAR